MDREVFSTDAFKQYVSGKWILVLLDFPRKSAARDPEQNKRLKQKYDVGGYPTMVMLDAAGLYLGRIVGYRRGSGVDARIKRLDALRSLKGKVYQTPPAGRRPTTKKPGAKTRPKKKKVDRAPSPASDERWKAIQEEYRRGWAQPDGALRQQAVLGLGGANRVEAAKKLIKLLLTKTDRHRAAFSARRQALLKEQAAARKELGKVGKAGRDTPAYRAASARVNKITASLKKIDGALWAGRNLTTVVISALARMWAPPVIEFFHAKGLSHRRWEVRAALVQALGLGEHKGSRAEVRKKIGDRDPRVATAAIDAAARLGDAAATADVIKALSSKSWQVRAAAIGALGALRQADGVGPLVKQLKREGGRLLEDIDQALQKITGVSLGGSYKAWNSWYQANKARLPKLIAAHKARAKTPEKSDKGGSVTFYGIRTRSRRLCFVVDISGSMSGSASGQRSGSTTGARPVRGKGPGGRAPVRRGAGGGKTKIEVMKQELIKALKALPPRATFNIVYFDTGVDVLRARGMVTVTPASIQQTIQWIEKTLKPRGQTNIYDALDRAFKLSGPQTSSNYKLGVDTIFFMTDGMPGAGPVTDTRKILEEFTLRNKTRRIAIHCIQVGTLRSTWLRSLAERNGGTFVER